MTPIPDQPADEVEAARRTCTHVELRFGSGDYYIFCHACGRKWATMGDQPEYGHDADGNPIGADPTKSNQNNLMGNNEVRRQPAEVETVARAILRAWCERESSDLKFEELLAAKANGAFTKLCAMYDTLLLEANYAIADLDRLRSCRQK